MLTVAVCMALLGCLQAQALQGHVSIILLGATGDLAKKYLWQGLFQLYLDEAGKGYSFSFHGAALTPPQQGQELMAKALESLSCPKDMAPGHCGKLKEQFLQLSQYRQLKTDEHYQTLSKDIEAQVQREGLREAGRIFYFSVPPFAYADIARSINSSCRPGPGAWLRVVLEKPFGHDHRSAQQLATELGSFFQEEEMYRVDHYLGKQVSYNSEPPKAGVCWLPVDPISRATSPEGIGNSEPSRSPCRWAGGAMARETSEQWAGLLILVCKYSF
jgi:hexose-6-phosphate dehydrogenase